jgi:tetratricopeptide (TPR) repeat protein
MSRVRATGPIEQRRSRYVLTPVFPYQTPYRLGRPAAHRSVPEVSERLSAYLDDPVVENDERLRLRVLIIKGETDEDLDPSLSQRSWTEALALAQKLGEAGWANPARGELGLVAFLQGDTNTAIVNLGQAIKVAETSGDTSSLVCWLTLFGHGFVELGRQEQAFDFYERALKVARTVPELQMPFMTLVGKADALVKVGRVSEPTNS